MQHGVLIDETFKPNHNEVYNAFTEYFANPKMYKLKNVQGHSLYATKIDAYLGIEFRYLMVLVYEDTNPIGHNEYLEDIRWLSLQTRTMTDEHKISTHSYTPRHTSYMSKKIRKTSNDELHYFYSVENSPIEITLIGKRPIKQNSFTGTYSLEYGNTGTIANALETFQTIVTFVK